MSWVRVGSVLGMLAVVIGAFGAHALKDRLAATGYQDQFETAVKYHMFHVAGILVVGVLQSLQWRSAARGLDWAPWCFALGILVFSGSLYALAVSGERWLGAVTPFGGALMIAGWVGLALAIPPRG